MFEYVITGYILGSLILVYFLINIVTILIFKIFEFKSNRLKLKKMKSIRKKMQEF